MTTSPRLLVFSLGPIQPVARGMKRATDRLRRSWPFERTPVSPRRHGILGEVVDYLLFIDETRLTDRVRGISGRRTVLAAPQGQGDVRCNKSQRNLMK